MAYFSYRSCAVIYTVVIFVSASLLFFVQPMFAKMILPRLGGSPSVWTTAMLFFQTVLLAGYAYAHFLATHLSTRAQIGVHCAVWGAGLLFLPIAIPANWSFDPNTSLSLQALSVFALGVGIPFFALTANAPLLQKWYVRCGGEAARDPYHLYASSNAGSLLALLAYPLIAEPLLGSREISRIWAEVYVVFGAGLGLCGLLAVRGRNPGGRTGPKVTLPPYRTSKLQFAKWAALAFVPSSLMLGTTAIISADLGAFPLVWVIPLAIYLLTFVLAFSARLRPPQAAVEFCFLVSVIAVTVALAGNRVPYLGLIGFALLFVVFLCVALLFHMRLYDSRPPEGGLTAFYFAMSIGGALGGLFNSALAPLVFDSPIEAPAVLAVTGLALTGCWRPARDGYVAAMALLLLICTSYVLLRAGIAERNGMPIFVATGSVVIIMLLASRRYPLRFALIASGFLTFGYFMFWNDGVVHRARSYFGIYVVRDEQSSGLRALTHGSTTHGLEFIEDLGGKPRILSYYHPNSPLGQVMQSDSVSSQARIGVVGLGVGALGCYSRPGQQWLFFEIDSLVDDIARDPVLFSYMNECAAATPTIIGDARLSLERAAAESFDILVIDAYSSDAIPVHLMTLEALELYRSRLAPDGILALHISNRFYELAPILGNAAAAMGLDALEQTRLGTDALPIAEGETASQVVLMSRGPGALSAFASDPRWRPLRSDGRPAWTDDHASLLDAM